MAGGGVLVLTAVVLFVPADLRAAALALALIAGLVVCLFVLDEIRTQEKARQRGQRVKPLVRRMQYWMRSTPGRLTVGLGAILVGGMALLAWWPADPPPQAAGTPVSAAPVPPVPAAVPTPPNPASATPRLPMPTASVPVPTVTQVARAAVPTSAVAPVVAGKTGAAAAPAALDEIERSVRAWARDWSSRDVEAYLAAYSPDFTPASGISRDHWVQQRRERLAKARNPQVSLERLVISVQGSDQARVQFQQRYQAIGMDETITKTLGLVRSPDGRWRIRSEVAGVMP